MNKSIIFYSKYPQDQMSRVCLQEIDKNPAFSKQFIKICIHHPENPAMPPLIQLPQIIISLIDRVPILAISGHKQPILARDALTWLQRTLLNEDQGIKAGSLEGSIADDCSTIDQSEGFGTDFYSSVCKNLNDVCKDYASISETNNKIETYADESSKNKDYLNSLNQQKM